MGGFFGPPLFFVFLPLLGPKRSPQKKLSHSPPHGGPKFPLFFNLLLPVLPLHSQWNPGVSPPRVWIYQAFNLSFPPQVFPRGFNLCPHGGAPMLTLAPRGRPQFFPFSKPSRRCVNPQKEGSHLAFGLWILVTPLGEKRGVGPQKPLSGAQKTSCPQCEIPRGTKYARAPKGPIPILPLCGTLWLWSPKNHKVLILDPGAQIVGLMWNLPLGVPMGLRECPWSLRNL